MNAAAAAIDAVCDALDRLCLLGGPDPIAAFLRERGYRGTRRANCGCPVAGYLSAASGRVVEIAEQRWGFAGGQMDEGTVPAPVAEFIRRFDEGDYPDLALTEMEEVKAS